MWIAKADGWVDGLTQLEKLLMERVIQRCDYNESITNQHRTTNGYIQLKELVNLSVLSVTRGRTIRTVKVLLEEAKSDHFSLNIVNDIIIAGYFSDLKDFIKKYDASRLISDGNSPNLGELNAFIHQLKIYECQLEDGYIDAIIKEFRAIDYKETKKIERNAQRIAELVDILLPYLVFKGYAISSLSEVLRSWIGKKYRTTFRKIFPYFNFHNRKYEYVILLHKDFGAELDLFLKLLKDEQNAELIVGEVSKLKEEYPQLKIFEDAQKVVLYNHEDFDPHIHFRNTYNKLLKSFVQTKDRVSLSSFNDFFNSCYWRIPKKGKQFHKLKINNDPLNVNTRNRTLRKTLADYQGTAYQFEMHQEIPTPKNEQVRNSLYYYHLALGSKSIENSLSLLWTSLEALLPYRTHYSDIECVQYFVSKTLSLGALGRDLRSFSQRILAVNSSNGGVLDVLEIEKLKATNPTEILSASYSWITNNEKETIENRFSLMKEQSELLAFEYLRLGRPMIEGDMKKLCRRIETSSLSIQYQLQRIYVHRNQIIHAGNLVNEYSNMWVHLEWYIGKLLAFSIANLDLMKRDLSLSDLFISVEADYDYVTSYLHKNSGKKTSEMSSRISEILFKYSWQT